MTINLYNAHEPHGPLGWPDVAAAERWAREVFGDDLDRELGVCARALTTTLSPRELIPQGYTLRVATNAHYHGEHPGEGLWLTDEDGHSLLITGSTGGGRVTMTMYCRNGVDEAVKLLDEIVAGAPRPQ